MLKRLRERVWVFGWAIGNLLAGVVLGLTLLEITLQVNPSLLLHGMALLIPIDPPLTTQYFDVRYSDGDLFYWTPDLIKPIPPDANLLEAHVRFVTDEFGFPNTGPLPPKVDVVVLGRSYSLGAQASDPWPQALAEHTGWRVLNLSQAGSSIDTKLAYLRQFGLPRQPHWVIVDVLPSMDIVGYGASDAPLLIQRLPFPIIQYYARQVQPPAARPLVDPIYPLAVDIPGQVAQLAFFDYYLSALSVNQAVLAASNQWAAYQHQLLAVVTAARAQGACVALLFVPTESEIYLPLAKYPNQLAPAVAQVTSWRLNQLNDLIQDNQSAITSAQLISNALDARDLVAGFAQTHQLVFIDPVNSLTQAALTGKPPFMVYDTHWSAIGHSLVASQVAQQLQTARCP